MGPIGLALFMDVTGHIHDTKRTCDLRILVNHTNAHPGESTQMSSAMSYVST